MVQEYLEKGSKVLSKEEREAFAKRYELTWIGRMVDIQGLVVARKGNKHFHVRYADGTPAYTASFTAVGNFQKDGLAPARDKEKKCFHIHLDGTPAYDSRFDTFFDDGSFCEDGLTWAEKDGKMYDVDRQGKIIKKAGI